MMLGLGVSPLDTEIKPPKSRVNARRERDMIGVSVDTGTDRTVIEFRISVTWPGVLTLPLQFAEASFSMLVQDSLSCRQRQDR